MFVDNIESDIIARDIKSQRNTSKDLFAFVIAFFTRFHAAPTFREMCQAIDIIQNKKAGTTSKGVIWHHLRKLEETGKIVRNSGRIRVVNSEWIYHEASTK